MCPYIVSGNNMDLLSRDTWKTTFWNILSLTYISLHGAIQTIVTNYRIAVSDALFFVSKPHLLNMAPACSDAIKKCWAWVIFLSLFFHLLCSCVFFCVWANVDSMLCQGSYKGSALYSLALVTSLIWVVVDLYISHATSSIVCLFFNKLEAKGLRSPVNYQ